MNEPLNDLQSFVADLDNGSPPDASPEMREKATQVAQALKLLKGTASDPEPIDRIARFIVEGD